MLEDIYESPPLPLLINLIGIRRIWQALGWRTSSYFLTPLFFFLFIFFTLFFCLFLFLNIYIFSFIFFHLFQLLLPLHLHSFHAFHSSPLLHQPPYHQLLSHFW